MKSFKKMNEEYFTFRGDAFTPEVDFVIHYAYLPKSSVFLYVKTDFEQENVFEHGLIPSSSASFDELLSFVNTGRGAYYGLKKNFESHENIKDFVEKTIQYQKLEVLKKRMEQ